MEWIWYIIAALGAGIGTGLAGLSAATVMVPILIVLCPSFAGETGAYQATAIALASDILGSAVTTYTYAKHKNIDLKRGWIMLVRILGMCTVGSYVAFTCFAVMTLSAASWQVAALSSVLIAIALYPLLSLVEHEKWYGKLFVQKSPGEVKRSLLMLFFMFAAVIAVAWGIFGNPHIAVASILMWGMGDASAALVGIPCGSHKIKTRYAVKPWEGTIAMFIAAFLSGVIVLHFFGGFDIGRTILAALLAGVVSAATELFSPSEWDTVTVPVAILIVLLAAV
ncbi:MAG: TSUP family transporter [Blautia sp.]|nr:TSUP family transporter [Blautia sp.]